MTIAKYRKHTSEDLVQIVKSLAIERGQALEVSDPKRANLLYKDLANICREIRSRGVETQRQLLPLLDSEDVYVRLWVATCALEFDATRAVPILEEIDQNGSPLVGFTAGMVLKQWREGKFHFM